MPAFEVETGGQIWDQEISSVFLVFNNALCEFWEIKRIFLIIFRTGKLKGIGGKGVFGSQVTRGRAEHRHRSISQPRLEAIAAAGSRPRVKWDQCVGVENWFAGLHNLPFCCRRRRLLHKYVDVTQKNVEAFPDFLALLPKPGCSSPPPHPVFLTSFLRKDSLDAFG